MEQYISYGIENNPEIAAAYNAYEATYARIDFNSGLPYPKISAGYFIQPVETRQGPQLGKISVSQMFPWFGTLSAREQQTAELANAQYNLYLDKANFLAHKISSLYYDLYFFNKKISVLNEHVELYKKIEEEARIKFETGKGSSVDVIIFQMLIDELKNEKQNTENILAEKKQEFNLLLNRNQNADVSITDTLEVPALDFDIDTLLNNNQKIQAYDNLVSSATYKAKAEKLSQYPQIGVSFDYIFTGTDASLSSSGKDAFMPMISFSVPIYGKKYKSLNKSNDLNIIKTQNEQQNVELTLKAELENLSKNYENTLNNYELYKDLLQKAHQNLEIIYASYSTSEVDFNQIIFVENQILNYKLKIIRSIADLKQIESEYKYLTGSFFNK